jgi:hypothetical protein
LSDDDAKLPVDASGRRPAFFAHDGVDQLVTMVLELATELWVVRERVFVIEAVAAQQGLPLKDAVEAYKPSEAERAELERMRGTMMNQLFRTLNQDHRPVESSAKT